MPGEPKNIVLLRLVRALKAFRAMRMVRTFWPECAAEFPSVSGGCGRDCQALFWAYFWGVFFLCQIETDMGDMGVLAKSEVDDHSEDTKGIEQGAGGW